MNNIRGNNRRRGRGGNRQQGGGQQLNRIDSRARGNAPQLLEKYRKLAHDAHLNGDRVQEEYYLQFAEHYFRVLADQRQRQDEQREQRQQRWQEGPDQGGWREDGEDGPDDAGDGEFPSYDHQSGSQRRDRDERPRDERPRDERPRDERPHEDARGDSDEAGDEPRSQYEPAENPFVRESRNPRTPRPRREARGPRAGQNRDGGDHEERGETLPLGLDPASLPPAISSAREDVPVETAGDAEEAKPRRRTRKPKPPADDTGEKLETVT